MEGSKPVKADTVTGKEVPKATNKEDGSQTSKSTDKKPAQQHSNRASSGTQDDLVCYYKDILTDGHKDKCPKDHISVHCIQRAGRVLLISCLRRNRKCQTSFSTWISLLLMDQLYRVASGQAYPGTQTFQKL